MNIDEASRFLRVTTRALERWRRQGLLSDECISDDHFNPEALERWARERGIVRADGPGSVHTPVGDLFSKAVLNGAVTSVDGHQTALSSIELAVSQIDSLSDEQKSRFIAQTLVRERLMSTALGRGVAAPHPRQALGDQLEDQVMSVLYLESPVDWAAPDGIDVHTVLLLLSPSMELQLQLLSRVGTALRTPTFPEFLGTRPDKTALLEELARIHGDS
jgi:nitrogen PTS system EIIA component